MSAHEWPIYWYRPKKKHIGQSLNNVIDNFYQVGDLTKRLVNLRRISSFTVTFEPETLESQSKASIKDLDSSLVSTENFNKILPFSGLGPGQGT